MCTDCEPLHTQLPCDREAPGAARSLLTSWMCARHHPDCLGDALLLLSEVVTNAVVHSGPPLEIGFGFAADCDLRIAVHDGTRSLAAPVVPPDDVSATEDLPEHGRGLPLVVQLSQGWSVEPDERGKTFVFSVACDPD